MTPKGRIPDESAVRNRYRQVTELLIRRGLTITAMESCTGGMIASLLTDTEGSSAVFRGSFVSYSNEAKCRFGVPEKTIRTHGVYSPETAAEMARACRVFFDADIGTGITGSFGNPDPANPDSIPDEIDFAIDMKNEGCSCFHVTLPSLPDRRAAKLFAADRVAEALLDCMGTPRHLFQISS